MVAKAVFFLCAQVFMIQSIAGQYTGWAAAPLAAAPLAAAPLAAAPWAAVPCGAAGIYGAELLAPATAAASHGGALPIASGSPIPPKGVSVASENAYGGELAVRGALPFLGTVGLEGALPTAGSAAVNYGCGNGAVGILTEEIGAAGIAGPLAYEAPAPLGYRAGALEYDAAFGAPYGRTGCGSGVLL